MVHKKIKFSYDRHLKQGSLTINNESVRINLNKKQKSSFYSGAFVLDGKKINAGGYGLELI